MWDAKVRPLYRQLAGRLGPCQFFQRAQQMLGNLPAPLSHGLLVQTQQPVLQDPASIDIVLHHGAPNAASPPLIGR